MKTVKQIKHEIELQQKEILNIVEERLMTVGGSYEFADPLVVIDPESEAYKSSDKWYQISASKLLLENKVIFVEDETGFVCSLDSFFLHDMLYISETFMEETENLEV